MHRRLAVAATTFFVLGFVVVHAADPARETVDSLPADIRYNEHIRPILSDRCFYCHGPDDKHREANLRLDTREGAIADRDGVIAIVPGKPGESELFARATSHDEDAVMPPPSSKKARLTPTELALLKKWIEAGAPYEEHWAFLPLREAKPPAVSDMSRIRNPIDQFIIERLQREGLQPSPEADRAVLMRRAYLDLVGLLPTPAEAKSFLADASPDAYEKLVDRLLASPHHGERWGRHWLDQARYADSNGYSIDAEREMWPYRDWVIQALNDDMPFDQFTIEQIAGDLLPKPSKSQLVATAFHRNTLINQEGGTDREQFRVESAMDRVNTTGAVWLGLTVGCAQCHTHKFDPITHREYYELFAFFNSTTDVNDRGATVSVVRGEMFGTPISLPPEPPPPSSAELAKKRSQWEVQTLAKLEQATFVQSVESLQWSPVEYVDFGTESNASFRRLPDNSLLSDGRGSFNDTYRIKAVSELEKIAAVRLRVIADESLPMMGPGRAGNGNFVLTDLEIKVDGKPIAIGRAIADHEQPGYPAAAIIDDDPKSGWAINRGPNSRAKMNENHEVAFTLAEPIVLGKRQLEIELHHGANKKYLIGRFAIEVSPQAPAAPKGEDAAMLAALRTRPEQRTPAEQKSLQQAFDRSDPKAKEKKTNPNVADQMIMRELKTPRECYLLTRGDFTRPDKSLGGLQPGVLAAVAPKLPSGSAPATRHDLAKWLVHPDNPLTPRVTVNRIWMRYFGRGLVETEEDFGAQGSYPVNADLLDWLAREFIRQGWSQKKLHRLIATSAVYRQSSRMRADLIAKDPRNLLLGRQERLRLDAEIVRDAALCASGLIDRTIGGPSVKPPQPDGVYAFTQTPKKWDTEKGPNRYRRAMYTFFYRSAPYPLFTTFDSPDFQSVCTRRNRSNTPLQSTLR